MKLRNILCIIGTMLILVGCSIFNDDVDVVVKFNQVPLKEYMKKNPIPLPTAPTYTGVKETVNHGMLTWCVLEELADVEVREDYCVKLKNKKESLPKVKLPVASPKIH